MNILITGSNGFLGRNFYRYLRKNTDYKVFTFTKKDIFEKLEDIVQDLDCVFHFAGVNRTKIDSEFKDVNANLTKKVCNLLTQNINTSLYYASSIQVKFKNEYGVSKKEGENICLDLKQKNNNDVFILRFPNIYGTGCKPNYNSVVATFCYNTANNLEHHIADPNRILELVYIDDLCSQLNSLIKKKNECIFVEIENKFRISLKDLSCIINDFKNVSLNSEYIEKRTKFEKNLYKIYLSYLSKKNIEE